VFFWNLPFEGGFFNVVTRLASRVSPLGLFETNHLINAIFGLLGVFAAYKLGKLVAGPLAGFLSALFLVVTPRFYGHAFNNPKDIPMATLSIFSIYYLIRLVHHLPRASKGSLLKLGVVVGLAVAVRVGAIILLGYTGIAFCLWFVARYLLKSGDVKLESQKAGKPESQRARKPESRKAGKREQDMDFWPVISRLARTFLVICVIAYLVMLIWWPAAQVRPIIQPVKSLRRTAHFGDPLEVFFEGRTISNMDVPRYYTSKWVLITLPEFYFIALAVGLALGVISILQHRKDLSVYNNEQTLGISILLVCIVLPIVYTVLTSPVDYDGMRHFLFVIPPLAVIAAISLAKLVEQISFSLEPENRRTEKPESQKARKSESRKAGKRVLASSFPRSLSSSPPRLLAPSLSGLPAFASIAVIVAIFASVAITVVDMWQLHPYEYIFFNRLFGKGVAEAAKSFETDYWGNSYKEGVEWIVKNYRGGGIDRRIKVASCSYSLSTSYFLPQDRFEYVGSFDDGHVISHDEQPDLLLATTRWNCYKLLSGKVLHTVRRKGVPLLYVIKLSDGSFPLEQKGIPKRYRELDLE
jgi:hypothetical protein